MTDSYLERHTRYKAVIYAYLETPFNKRMNLTQFKKLNKITQPIYEMYKEKYNLDVAQERERKVRQVSDLLGGAPINENFELDPVGWWKARTLEINEAIIASAKRGNAQSQKLAKQLAGELVEKAEVKVGFDINQAIRTNLEADRKLREMGYRVADVSEKPALLPEKLCQDSGQSSSADNTVD